MHALLISEDDFRSTILVDGPECSEEMVHKLASVIWTGASSQTSAENKSIEVAAVGSITRITAPDTWLLHLSINNGNLEQRMKDIFNLIGG